MSGPGALLLGETSTFNGRTVARVGLAGAAAYLVDGRPCTLADAAALVSAENTARGRQTCVSARRAARAASKPAPELLDEVRAALKGDRGLAFAHRTFAGGEAVTVRLGDGAAPIEKVIAKLCGTGLYAERGPDGSVVAAWTKAVLSGEAGKAKR